MCDNVLNRLEEDALISYTCKEVKENRSEWLQKFMQNNKCKQSDKAYIAYERNILGFLLKCKELDYTEIIESIPKDDRIRFAKTCRELGYSPWATVDK